MWLENKIKYIHVQRTLIHWMAWYHSFIHSFIHSLIHSFDCSLHCIPWRLLFHSVWYEFIKAFRIRNTHTYATCTPKLLAPFSTWIEYPTSENHTRTPIQRMFTFSNSHRFLCFTIKIRLYARCQYVVAKQILLQSDSLPALLAEKPRQCGERESGNKSKRM